MRNAKRPRMTQIQDSRCNSVCEIHTTVGSQTAKTMKKYRTVR